ncbi:sporulation histidine kinase inhibitor Sda [Metabacillus bambusae]|uniref:Sporulation histidine kinase inhibitor Sda n=1 Tax=Metabacillus bambusae TaxID=2795218 RepID=A0ABS3MZP8_9BACI|nr:sporulation histidine kinase inhibitor Sda [Metabacillus bambusae]MBO1511487.1 sporulation histidine kinase inhibitor Sda [Metabacillus bambusae]
MIQKLSDKDLMYAYSKAITLNDIDKYFVYLLKEEVKRRYYFDKGLISYSVTLKS